MAERHLHQRFQEYLDCFMESDVEPHRFLEGPAGGNPVYFCSGRATVSGFQSAGSSKNPAAAGFWIP